MLTRQIEPLLKQYLSTFSSVALTGPRQSGKSTLLRSLLPDYQYVNFDDGDMRELFYDDPKGFMKRYSNYTIFDEAQKVPEIFERVKIEIDEDRYTQKNTKGKFILSGSSQFLMLEKISESLAGRVGLLELLPLNYTEMPVALRKASIYSGSYPELVQQNFTHHTLWYNAYVQTYLEKDVRDLLKVSNLRDFRRLLTLLAAQTAQQLSMVTLANQLGVSSHTIKSWITVLEASYIIFLLQPYHNNFGKRIVKSPKIYFWDTGLAAHLTKIYSEELYDYGPMSGQLFENYMISEIAKKQKYKTTPSDLYYFRTNHGIEIDCIVEDGLDLDCIEIKKSHSYSKKMLSHLSNIYQNKQQITPYLLYQGESLPDKILPDQNENKSIRIWNYSDYLNL